MLEGKFNLKMTKAIRRRGLFCYKTADRFHPGVPDIYIAGGNWIESKVVEVGSQNRTINLFDKLSEAQKEFGRDLIAAGDRVWLVYRIEGKTSKHLIMKPLEYMAERPEWRVVTDILSMPEIKSEMDYEIDYFIDAIKKENIQ